MMRFRQIHTKIWIDEWFAGLDLPAKLFYIYLFSNARASVAGIYELAMRVMVFESGLTEEQIKDALAEYEAAGKVWYRDGVVLIPNLRKYHWTKSPSIAAGIAKDFSLIPECELKQRYREMYDLPSQDEQIDQESTGQENGSTADPEISLTLPHHSPAMSKLEKQGKEWNKLPKLGDKLSDDDRVKLRDDLLTAVNKGRRGSSLYTYDGGNKETKLKEVIAYCNIRQVSPQVIMRGFFDDDGFWYTESFGRNGGNPPHPKNIINELEKAVKWYNDRFTVTR